MDQRKSFTKPFGHKAKKIWHDRSSMKLKVSRNEM